MGKWCKSWSIIITLVMVVGCGPENAPTELAASDTGYRDLPFSGASGVGIAGYGPTGAKPQSKLWFNDGTWWGVLFNRSTEEYQIYRYNWSTHAWSGTGTVVDESNNSKADTLWDGSHLYLVSAGPDSSLESDSARVMRYSYDATTKKYLLDSGFPLTITSGGMEAIVLAKDTTGKLWVTYTQSNLVYVAHSLGDELSWSTPFVLPVEGNAVDPDDISSVIDFDSQIGVMWSNQLNSTMYFATHKDGEAEDVWQASPVIQGEGLADDHINLKADSGGRVYAATKTSLDSVANLGSNEPLNLLLVRERDGSWASHVFGRKGDDLTQSIVLLDEEHRGLYMFASGPCCNGGTIYYKQTSLDTISFPEGQGLPFIESSTDTTINDATSTKQNLDGTTGLLVLASDNSSGYYLHNAIQLDE